MEIQRQLDTMGIANPYWIAVDGFYGAGRTSFIRSCSQTPNQTLETSALTIQIDSDTDIIVRAVPRNHYYDFLDHIYSSGQMLGMVYVLDSCALETLRVVQPHIKTYEVYYRAFAPLIIACNKQDMDGAWSPDDIRLAAHIPADIPVVPCVATDTESVKQMLVTLLEQWLHTIDADVS